MSAEATVAKMLVSIMVVTVRYVAMEGSRLKLLNEDRQEKERIKEGRKSLDPGDRRYGRYPGHGAFCGGSECG